MSDIRSSERKGKLQWLTTKRPLPLYHGGDLHNWTTNGRVVMFSRETQIIKTTL